jgi:hypothetical protein
MPCGMFDILGVWLDNLYYTRKAACNTIRSGATHLRRFSELRCKASFTHTHTLNGATYPEFTVTRSLHGIYLHDFHAQTSRNDASRIVTGDSRITERKRPRRG